MARDRLDGNPGFECLFQPFRHFGPVERFIVARQRQLDHAALDRVAVDRKPGRIGSAAGHFHEHRGEQGAEPGLERRGFEVEADNAAHGPELPHSSCSLRQLRGNALRDQRAEIKFPVRKYRTCRERDNGEFPISKILATFPLGQFEGAGNMRILLTDAAWGSTWSKVKSMTPGEFLLAFASHHSVAVYSGLAAIFGLAAIHLATSWQELLLPPLMVAAIYPMVEFLVHRYVLHSQLFYKQPQTAAFWRRVHYDHHMNPNDLSVLFGALYT